MHPLDRVVRLRTLGRAVCWVGALGSCVVLAQSPATGDPVAGSQKIQNCSGCHGIEGWRTAFPEVYHVPKIAGQHEAYLVRALQGYRSGERSHPSMRAIAGSLSDQEIADLAAYYARGSSKTAAK